MSLFALALSLLVFGVFFTSAFNGLFYMLEMLQSPEGAKTPIRDWISMRAYDVCQYFRIRTYEPEPRDIPELRRYPETGPLEPWIDHPDYRRVQFTIIVPDEDTKAQVLRATKYIHDIFELDTDYIAVNELAHVYTEPDCVEVRPEEFKGDRT